MTFQKRAIFLSLSPPLKTPIGGLYYQYSLLHIFDLLKKGWFSLPFLAIIALLLFLRNLTFLVFRTVPLSLYTVSGNGTIPIFPISAACAALLLSFFFLHSLLHLTPSRLDRLSYHYIILPFSLQIKNYRYYQHHNTYRNKQDADKNTIQLSCDKY